MPIFKTKIRADQLIGISKAMSWWLADNPGVTVLACRDMIQQGRETEVTITYWKNEDDVKTQSRTVNQDR